MGRKSTKIRKPRPSSRKPKDPYGPMASSDGIHGFSVPSLSIYVLLADQAVVKIGRSKDAGQRARSIQTSQEKNVTVYWATRMCREEAIYVEKVVHRRLKKTKYHSQGEWYYIDPNLAVSIIIDEIKKSGFKPSFDTSFGMFRDNICLQEAREPARCR